MQPSPIFTRAKFGKNDVDDDADKLNNRSYNMLYKYQPIFEFLYMLFCYCWITYLYTPTRSAISTLYEQNDVINIDGHSQDPHYLQKLLELFAHYSNIFESSCFL